MQDALDFLGFCAPSATLLAAVSWIKQYSHSVCELHSPESWLMLNISSSVA